ncbi:hypothetical protein MNB_SV-14-186 [hydrothermal vent metagenome]|uniref:DUF1501 domain-containing protein n=1 Tax=hydrothermal vent metagenome TaxID=652676 RepID=A0A1W1CL73_9ZZZZ
MGVGDFYKAIKEMGMENEITTFNISDFGRSTGENGDGTDHAWGSNLFVVGGAVKGGVYGTIVKWFGADDVVLAKVVPELGNFDVKDLGFMG